MHAMIGASTEAALMGKPMMRITIFWKRWLQIIINQICGQFERTD